MGPEIVMVVSCVAGLIFCRLGIRWWRRRHLARQADQLLAHVVKAKDAFRRH